MGSKRVVPKHEIENRMSLSSRRPGEVWLEKGGEDCGMGLAQEVPGARGEMHGRKR